MRVREAFMRERCVACHAAIADSAQDMQVRRHIIVVDAPGVYAECVISACSRDCESRVVRMLANKPSAIQDALEAYAAQVHTAAASGATNPRLN